MYCIPNLRKACNIRDICSRVQLCSSYDINNCLIFSIEVYQQYSKQFSTIHGNICNHIYFYDSQQFRLGLSSYIRPSLRKCQISSDMPSPLHLYKYNSRTWSEIFSIKPTTTRTITHDRCAYVCDLVYATNFPHIYAVCSIYSRRVSRLITSWGTEQNSPNQRRVPHPLSHLQHRGDSSC